MELKIMRIKDILGKEVLNTKVEVVGKITDIEIDSETYQIINLIVQKGNFSEKMSIKKSEDVIPIEMVSAIGDKILLKDIISDAETVEL
jgi:sporulation protein YlmC with PRC-barrel domain